MASARTSPEENRDEILRLAAPHGAANVRVFGSVARGEDRDDSDIERELPPLEAEVRALLAAIQTP